MRRPQRRQAFRLAQQCGRIDVDTFMSEIPSKLFTEWLAFHIIEPPTGLQICAYIRQLTMYVVSFLTGKEVPIEDLIIPYGESFMKDDDDEHAKEVEVKLKAALATLGAQFPGAIKKIED